MVATAHEAELTVAPIADRRTRVAMAVSLGLHVALVALAVGRAPSYSASTPDVWGGDTLELDSISLSAVARAHRDSAGPPDDAPRAPGETTRPAGEAPRTSPTARQVALPSRPAHRSSERARRPARDAAVDGAAVGDGLAAKNDAGAAAAGVTQGTQDAPSSTRSLAKAFTRAIPFGTRADPLWGTLPFGPAGSMTVVFELSDEGRIVRAKPKQDDVPLALRHLLERTLVLLRMGRFAPASPLRAGREVLRVDARLERAAVDPTYGESDEAMSLDYDPPSLDRPGRAAFQLGNGRRLEVRVSIVDDDESH